jgi:hypothetical protein
MDIATAILVFGLFIIVLAITVCAFIFKHIALAMVSGVLWLFIGLYSLFNPDMPIALTLGVICVLMAIVMFISPAFTQVKPVIPARRSYQEDMSDRIEKMRGHGASFKAKRNMEDLL